MDIDYNELKETEALYRKFNEASKALPELCYDADPLSMGNFGIVIQHDDDTLTKIFFKPSNKDWHDSVRTCFEQETNALKLLGQTPLEGLETPTILGEPSLLENKNYMAQYSMTRITGQTHIWTADQKHCNAPLEKFYENAGHALAKFQSAASNIPFDKAPHFSETEISASPFLDTDTNEALITVDKYLQSHKIAGVIHGDYHGGNIMIDSSYKVTGLIDFATTGQSDNILHDFMAVPERYMPDFTKAYETESGITIDPDAIQATKLARWVSYLNSTENYPEAQENALSEISDCLESLEHITGFTPDF